MIGMMLMHWDIRSAGQIKIKIPETLEIDNRDLIQIYSQHEYTGKPGLVSFNNPKTNLLSYYLGPKVMNYIVLFLDLDEDVTLYETVLSSVAFQFAEYRNDADLHRIFNEVFQIVSNFPKYSDAQKYALFFYNPLFLAILRAFQEEMIIPQSELEIILREKVPQQVDLIPNAIDLFIQLGFLKLGAVKGIGTDLLYQIDDIHFIRHPPMGYYTKLLENGVSPDYIEQMKTESKKIFTFYKNRDDDLVNLVRKIMLDPLHYQVFELLKGQFLPDDKLDEIEKKLGVKSIQPNIDALVAAELISIIKKPQSRDYFVAIRSEITIERRFPEYHIDLLADAYRTQKHHNDVLLKGLELLKENYLTTHAKNKKKKQTKSKK
jgi:hypothetical protein